MPTIRDVAKRAGVAPITVSRVINNSGYISAETRKRVEAAIAELQYVPNSLARSLRSNQTHTLALVLTDITNPFWTTVTRGVEDAAHQAGYNVIVCNTDENEAKQAEYLPVLLQKQVDGFLLVPARSAAEPVNLIQKQGVPVVVLDRRVPGVEVDIVRGASERGMYQLVRYLLDLGHRRIAILSGPEQVSVSKERVAGYQRALHEAGIDQVADSVYYGPFTQANGYEKTQQILCAPPQPTALVAGNNFIAIGALQALREAGLRVPEDMSVASFDDLPSELVIEPFLTAVVQPAYQMGQRATELLLARITGQVGGPCQEIVLPTELIIRRSCRAVNEVVPQKSAVGHRDVGHRDAPPTLRTET
jgi:LacI family transcriptional regulator